MSNHGITVDNLLATFPEALARDENLQALATAIANVLNARVPEIDRVRIYPNIDGLPEDLLDILAVDLKIDWYDAAYPLAIKRRIVKSSIEVHRVLGTKGAVARALSAIYPGTTVEEWFEYGGNFPYFRIILDVTQQTIEVSHDEIVKAVNIYKSLRSKLEDDAIVYRAREEFILKTSTGYITYHNRACGTYPQTMMQGDYNLADILAQIAAGSMIYNNPLSGDIVSGTYPHSAKQGDISYPGLLLETGTQDHLYENPAAGELNSGEYPDTAVQGDIQGPGIKLGTKSASESINIRMCGSSPGSLM